MIFILKIMFGFDFLNLSIFVDFVTLGSIFLKKTTEWIELKLSEMIQ